MNQRLPYTSRLLIQFDQAEANSQNRLPLDPFIYRLVVETPYPGVKEFRSLQPLRLPERDLLAIPNPDEPLFSPAINRHSWSALPPLDQHAISAAPHILLVCVRRKGYYLGVHDAVSRIPHETTWTEAEQRQLVLQQPTGMHASIVHCLNASVSLGELADHAIGLSSLLILQLSRG